MTPAAFEQLKERIVDLEEEAAKANGAIEQILTTLEEDHGCSSIKEAEKLLKKLEREISKDDKQLDVDWKEFQNKWGDKL